MKTILVATDFSEASSHAARYAADMAMTLKANLFLMHTYQIPISYSELPLTANVEELLKGAEVEMEKLKSELLERSHGSLTIDTEVSEGFFFQELRAVCEKLNPFAVVIGTQGKTPTERLFFGSEAVYTMKHLVWPIIAVPLNSTYKTIQKIGLASDLHQVKDIPLDEIKMFIENFNAEFHILNTAKKETHPLDLDARPSVLFELMKDLKPQYHFIHNKNVDEGTLEFAEKNQIDLLMVLPKRHSLISQLMFKSHTKQFVLHSHVPVMALHK